MLNSLLRSCIYLLLLFQGTLAMCGEMRVPANLQRIADPNTKESDVLALMKRLRAAPPTDEQAKLWAQIANSDQYSDDRRRRALLLLFERHVRSGMELRTVASLLANPTWLKKENVHIVDLIGGSVPVDLLPGETVFLVGFEFSSTSCEACVCFLRVQGELLESEELDLCDPYVRQSCYNALKSKVENSFCNAILGNESEYATLKMTAVGFALTPSYDLKCTDDEKLFDRTNEMRGLERIANPRAKERDVLVLMEQLRATPPSDEQAQTWVEIMNSDDYSDIRRRRAVLLYFERHVYSGTELRTVESQLSPMGGYPTWLKKDNIHMICDPVDKIPIDMVPGETVFVIIPEFSSLDKSIRIYLRVQGSPSVESFYKVLGHDNTCFGSIGDTGFFHCHCGREYEVEKLKITAVGISPSDDDRKLSNRTSKMRLLQRINLPVRK